jgi:CHAT domain-containing protein/Tfp pilus assembly protein PilF
MNGRRAGWFGLVLAWVLAAGGLPAAEPALTAEQQRLLQEARKLQAKGVALYGRAQLPAATDRLRQALDLYQRVYSRDKYPDGHTDLAGCLSWLAAVLEAQGRYEQAEPFFRRALALYQALYPREKYPDGHPDLASCLSNLGLLLQTEGEYGQAEPLFRRALEMTQALYPRAKYPDGHPNLAHSLNNLGLLLQTQGEYGQAETLYRQALAMNQALYPKAQYPDGHPDLALSLNNLGTVLQAQGVYGQAEPLFRRALALDQALYPRAKYPDGHPHLAYSLNNLGSVLLWQGEYGQAEPFLRQALAMRQALYPQARYKDGHPHLAQSIHNLGLLFLVQGEYGQAEPFFRRALAMYQALYPRDKHPDGHPFLAVCLNTLGFVLQEQGAYDQAERLLRQALEMHQALYPPARYPDGHPDLARSLGALGSVLHDQGEYTKAEPFYRRALAMNQALYPRDRYPDGHPDLAYSLNDLGLLLLDEGEHGPAEPFLRQALDLFTRQAERLAQVAPEPVALNAAATFPCSRDTFLSATRPLPGAAARTYEAVWHSKASLTRVYRRRHLALLAAATDPAVRNDWDQLQRLRRQREQLIMAPASTPAQQAARQDKLVRLNKQLGQAEQKLRPRLPALPHYEELAQRGPAALQQRLPGDTVLVDVLRYIHFEHDPSRPGRTGAKHTDRYLAFVVSRQDVRRVELGAAADLDAAVQQWRQAITERLPAGNDAARRDHDARLLRHGRRLRDLVWEPVEKRFPGGVRTVYVAPDGELTRLPWAALPGRGPDRVLLDDYAVAVVPHGPFLLEQLTPSPARAAQRPPAPEGLLLVGGIRYNDRPAAAVARRGAEPVVAQPVRWDYLPGTAAERRLLEGLLRKAGPPLTASLGGAEASTARLRQELERVRYAHVATHGFFADKQFRSVLQLDPKLFERRMDLEGHILERRGAGARSPLVLSGLVCAGANRPDTPERGILSADAIAGLLLDDLQLAVLSACDTGLGDVAGGEGVFGLQRAFHIAGCHNVVVSLWKVDDAATAALMARFYGSLFAADPSRRLPPIEALRRAQLDLYRHPELIPAWSRGEDRAPGKPRPATAPPSAGTPLESVTSAGRAPVRLWAAFTLSGLGR